MSRSVSDSQSSNYFALLGFAPQFELDRDRLEQAYLALASASHPDRFASEGSGAMREAMEKSAHINEGYRVLRDPVRRAEYLVKLRGIDLDSSDASGGAPKMDQAFLIEMIERREKVQEARSAGPSALETYRDEVEHQLDQAFGEAIAQLDDTTSASVHTAARTLVVRRYLQRLLDEIDQELDD